MKVRMIFMKTVSIFLLLTVLLQSSFCFATPKINLKSPDFEAVLGQYGVNLVKRRARNPLVEVSKSSLKVMGHQAQTILLIMMLSGVDMVRSHFEQANILRSEIDKEQLFEHIGEVAEIILNSGEIWSSIAGAGATSLALSRPIGVINQLISNSESRAIFKNLLISGIGTLITFVGWELGGELYEEARELIEDEDAYAQAESLGSLLRMSLRKGSNSREWKVLKLVFSNMFKILWENEKLRKRWLYNTWRFRVGTGEFTTLVLSMVTASGVGTTLFPGAGTIVGMMFGLTGGVLSMFIPEEIKDDITDLIKDGRESFWSLGMDYDGSLFKVRSQVIEIMANIAKSNEDMPSMLSYPARSEGKNRYLTVFFEKLYRIEEKRILLSKKIELAKQANNKPALREFESEDSELKASKIGILENITSYYKKEYDYLLNAIKGVRLFDYRDEKSLKKYPIIKDVFADFFKVEAIYQFFDAFETMALDIEKEPLYLNYVARFCFMTFDEDELYSILTKE